MTAGFLDPSPALSGAELTPEEQALITRVDGQNQSAHTLEKVALILAAAFGVQRLYLRSRLQEQMKEQEPSNLMLVAGATYNAFVPQWVSMVAPALVTGYLEGMGEVRHSAVPENVMQDVATDYAIKLGEHLNDVSMEALNTGYQAQLNRRVPPRKALENVLRAYGVPTRTMNSLIKIWTGEDTKVLSSMPAKNSRDERAARAIDRAFNQRAKQVGETEAWTARSQAKQLMWMWGVEHGTIPKSATRVWKTAHDERVCPACGPLDGMEVPVTEMFETSVGQYWSPPLHPKCRCDIHLAIHITEEFRPSSLENVGKALGDDPYDRDRRGRFAHRESRATPRVARASAAPQPEVETPEQAWARVKAQGPKGKPKGKELNLKPIELGFSLEGVNLTPIELTSKPKEQERVLPSPQITLRAGKKPSESVDIRDKQLVLPKFQEPVDLDAAKVPQNVLHNDIQRLDVPVYGLTNSSHAKDDILTGPDQQVYEKDEVDAAIKQYWDDLVNHDILMTFHHDTDDEWLHLETPIRPGYIWYIDQDTYAEVWKELLAVGRDGLYSTFNVPMADPHGAEETSELSAYDIANLSGMIDYVEENKPLVYRMDWGWAGEADTKPGVKNAVRYNPGKWQIQNHREENTELSNRPYIRTTTTPI